MRRFLTLIAPLLFVPVLATATDIEERWLVGVGVGTSHINSEDNQATDDNVQIDETGVGGGFVAGYGFGPIFALRASGAGSRHETTNATDDARFANFTVEGLAVFRDLETFRPYLAGGVGFYSLEASDAGLELEITGGGLLGGAGFYYFFTDIFALDVNARLDFIEWETQRARATLDDGRILEIEAPISDSGTAAELRVAASWWL